ncbi:MAG: sensor histidine kinase [Pseudanabaenaceae cyanobacterium]
MAGDWLQRALQDDAYIRWITGGQLWERLMAAVGQLAAAEPTGLMLASSPHVLPFLGPAWEVWVVDDGSAPLVPRRPQQPVPQGVQGTVSGPFCLCLMAGLGLLLVRDGEQVGLGWHATTLLRAIAALDTSVPLPVLLRERLRQAVPETPDPAKLSDWWAVLAVTPPPTITVPPLAETEMVCNLAHEVKTPLATIQTLTRSLRQRSDLPPVAQQRLAAIEAECREQIERFSLIFAAACPLPNPIPLAVLPVGDLLQAMWPEWVERGQRRAIALILDVPKDLPPCTSHQDRLQSLLGGLLDRLIRSLPPGSTIVLEVREAGDYLKLQFRVQRVGAEAELVQAVGQWLVWQPETGTVALSLAAANTLLQSLGARLSVRLATSPCDDEVLAVFLPRFSSDSAIG